MNRKQVDHFFRTLSRELGEEARAILTGAAAGALWGNIRPSVDIDFAMELKSKAPDLWQKVETAVDRTTRLTGIQANFAEDIDRWGLISLLDYKKHTHLYRRFGRLRVVLLDPAYWSIGKMTRYLDPDIRDMAEVFKRQHVPVLRLVRLWGEALRKSPRSTMLIQFRRQVEDFLRHQGPRIWGQGFNTSEAITAFHRYAKIKPSLSH
jgi:hypothetical protein